MTPEQLGEFFHDHGVTFPGTGQDEVIRLLSGRIALQRAIDRSSLGTPEAVAARASVSNERAAAVVARAAELEQDVAREALTAIVEET